MDVLSLHRPHTPCLRAGWQRRPLYAQSPLALLGHTWGLTILHPQGFSWAHLPGSCREDLRPEPRESGGPGDQEADCLDLRM